MHRVGVIRVGWQAVFLLIFLPLTASGQIQLGQNLKISTNGSIGFGYAGGFGNYLQGQHTTYFNGYGTLSGSYYNPNFLSFTVQPYYGRAQETVAGSAINSNDGVSATVSLFSGSRFPGSISFAKDFTNLSQYGLPGAGTFLESGSGSAFAIGWAAQPEHWPSLAVNFNSTSSSGDFLGSLGSSERTLRIFRLNSSYTLLGWRLVGTFDHDSNSGEAPSFLLGENVKTSGSAHSFSVEGSHALPLSGNLDLTWMRSSTESMSNDFSSDTARGAAIVTPFPAFTVAGSAHYTRNIVGNLINQLGAVPANIVLSPNSYSYGLDFSAGYTIAHRVRLQSYANKNVQEFMGREYSAVQYGGNLAYNYERPLFGLVNVSIGVSDTASKYGNQGAALVFNAAARRYFGRWEVSPDFSYFQQMETLYGLYATSTYSYGTGVQRRLGDQMMFSGNFRATHSGLSRQEGNGNHGENVSGTVTWRRYNVTACYSQASGHSLLNTTGTLTPTVLAPLITTDFIDYYGRSYCVSGGATFFRRLRAYGGFTTSLNSTQSTKRWSEFTGTTYNAGITYRTRKLTFKAEYGHVLQAITGAPFPPSVVTAYQFNISRWFNLF